MLATLLIVFREVIEAGLIVGIVLAATKGVPSRGLWVGYGVVGGVAGAWLVAAFAGEIAPLFEGAGQELFNAGILLVAVVMLTWHNVWMASHGRTIAPETRWLLVRSHSLPCRSYAVWPFSAKDPRSSSSSTG
jgi:high-affinity iron transporter